MAGALKGKVEGDLTNIVFNADAVGDIGCGIESSWKFWMSKQRAT
jgi:hypothetical protein